VDEANPACPLAAPYSAFESFRGPEGLAILVALPLLLFNLGCFLTAGLPLPTKTLLVLLATVGASSGTMATRDLKPFSNRLLQRLVYIAAKVRRKVVFAVQTGTRATLKVSAESLSDKTAAAGGASVQTSSETNGK